MTNLESAERLLDAAVKDKPIPLASSNSVTFMGGARVSVRTIRFVDAVQVTVTTTDPEFFKLKGVAIAMRDMDTNFLYGVKRLEETRGNEYEFWVNFHKLPTDRTLKIEVNMRT